MFKRIRGESGFTLVELLVVLAILAILIAVVVPNLAGLTGGAQTIACEQEADTVQQAMDTLMTQHSASAVEPPLLGISLSSATTVTYIDNTLVWQSAELLLRKTTDGAYTWDSTGEITALTCPY